MKTKPLADLAVKNILHKIQTSEFKSGEIITETQICELMNISRTPAREALIELVANGILDRIPRKGYKVSEMDNQYKVDIYVILGTLDALAAKLSMSKIDKDDIRHMKEITELIDVAIKYENYASYVKLQEKFHNVYIDKCENVPLKKMLEDIKLTVSRYTYYSDDPDKLFQMCKDMNNEHEEIITYFKNKDIVGLESFLINNHWNTKHKDMI